MRLPFAPPIEPMLSTAADALPGGEGWQFEPKWDGFRTVVFRDGDEILLQSRDGKPMDRYFPELVLPLPGGHWRDLLTGATHTGPRPLLTDVTKRYPVALLVPEGSGLPAGGQRDE